MSVPTPDLNPSSARHTPVTKGFHIVPVCRDLLLLLPDLIISLSFGICIAFAAIMSLVVMARVLSP